MMKKLFNKKTMVIYIVLLCLTLIAGCTMTCLSVHYSNKFQESAAKTSNKTTEIVTEVLTDLLTSISNGSITKNETEEKEPVYDNVTKGFLQKRNVSLVLMTVFYLLSVLSAAGITAAYQYPKYLESDKYQAKLKRLQKAEKIAQKAK